MKKFALFAPEKGKRGPIVEFHKILNACHHPVNDQEVSDRFMKCEVCPGPGQRLSVKFQSLLAAVAAVSY